MARKVPCTVQFKLWSVGEGEADGELLEEKELVQVESYADVAALYNELVADIDADLKEFNSGTLRTTISRNGGSAILRERFTLDGDNYLLTTHVELVGEKWGTLWETTVEGKPVSYNVVIQTNNYGTRLTIDGEEIDLTKLAD